MNKTKIKCLHRHSNKLYKFGLDKQANQKYQYRNNVNLFLTLSTRQENSSTRSILNMAKLHS